LYVLPA